MEEPTDKFNEVKVMNRSRKLASKVLVVDDDADLLNALTRRLESSGMLPFQATSAEEAITIFMEEQPDLVCVDVGLPGNDGLTFCEMILQSPDEVHCPIIVMTGKTDDWTVERCSRLCVYYIRKRTNLWRFLRPVIEELLPEPVEVGASPT